MKIKILLLIACIGICAGIASAIIYNNRNKPQPPVSVNYNPYDHGIYANGIVESYQASGSNINVYAEVSGTVTKIFVKDGQAIKKGDPLFSVDESVQREIVNKDLAQINLDRENLLNVQKQLAKLQQSFILDKKSVSQNALDNAIDAVRIAAATVKVSEKQYRADQALLDKYIIRSKINGIVLRVVVSIGDYASPLGSYDTYTESMISSVQLGITSPVMQVRAYVNELLVPRMPAMNKIEASMFIRGLTNVKVPLEILSIQPYVIPNIELSSERNERVDVRVLPVVFKFNKPKDINIYPGQLVDVYLKAKK